MGRATEKKWEANRGEARAAVISPKKRALVCSGLIGGGFPFPSLFLAFFSLVGLPVLSPPVLHEGRSGGSAAGLQPGGGSAGTEPTR